MARDSSGPKNEPQYAGTGAPSDAADLSEVATYAANVGNRKVGTTTTRTGLSGADVWEGLDFWDTTLNALFRYRSGAWTQVYSGTNLIIPTSVSGGTVNAAGKVSFTSASTVSVNGVFSSAFDNYRLFIKMTGLTGGGDMVMKLRAAGVDFTAAAYTGQRVWSANQSALGISQQINATTGWTLTAGTNQFAVLVVDLVSPFLAEQTHGTLNFSSVGSTVSNGFTGLFYNSNASADGFTLIASGFTGTAAVYGYQNS
jgi:hypothetical protein